jgi:hypothetical protein
MNMKTLLLALTVIWGSLSGIGVAVAEPANCRWESGYIPPTMETGALKGPFLVMSLQAAVDPAQPNRPNFAITTVDNTWFPTANFRGPFFLPAGKLLAARNDWTAGGLLYSGCRM